MASGMEGKKGKKSKGKTVNLNDFLADESAAPAPGQAVVIAPRKITSWADEVDNEDETMYESRKERVVLPTAPRSARGNEVDEDRVPQHPPFLAYMSNLPYDLEEDDLIAFFEKLKIVKVRLPKDDSSNRLKGFGYVEFEERNDLKQALGMTDCPLKNRRVRIEVSDNDGRRGGMGRDRDNSDRPLTDWRSGPREEGHGEERGGGYGRREYGGGGGFGRDREGGRSGGFGGERSERPAGPWERNRGGPEPERENRFGGDRDRGFGGDRGSDRGDRGGGFNRDRGYNRDSNRSGGFGNERYEGRSGYGGDREGREGGGGGGYERRGMSSFSRREGGGPPRDEESRYPRDDRPDREAEPPKERPKLNLAPRTKPPLEEGASDAPAATTAAAPVSTGASSAAIFGGAKPVDTLSRELEIEERLAKQRAAQAPKEGEGEAATAPAPAPAQPSWRSERQAGPPPQPRATSGERKEEEPPARKGDSENRYAPPGAREGGESRYQPPRGNYQSRQGHSPSDRRDAPRSNQPRDRAPQGQRSDDRPSRAARPDDRPPRKEERPARREVTDDPARMPKLEENRTPDFIGSNVYGALEDEIDVECD